MKKILLCTLALLALTLTPLFSAASEIGESDLPHEAGPGPIPDEQVEPSITFVGYASSRDVTIVGGVMSCVYYFCKNASDGFCSDVEGILIISGADTGKVPEMVKDLDTALSNHNRIMVKLSASSQIMGVRKILDVKLLNQSI